MEVLTRSSTSLMVLGLVSGLAAAPAAAATPRGPPDARVSVEVERTRPGVLAPGSGRSVLTGPAGTVELLFDPAPVGAAPSRPPWLDDRAREAAGLGEARVRVRPLARWESDGWVWGWSADVVQPGRLEAVRVYLDAEGRALGRVSLVQSAGQGRAFPRSPLMGAPRVMMLEERPDPDVLALPGLAVVGCVDEGERMCHPAPVAARDGAGDWLFDPDPRDPADAFAEVHAFLQLADARHRLEAVGLDRWARALIAIVNVRLDLDDDGTLDPFDNALYFPLWDRSADALLFGQAAAGDVAYDVDVLRHELTHAAAAAWLDLAPVLDELGYDHLPALLNEGWADYFTAAASGDPEVASYLGDILGMPGPLRRLDRKLGCPAHLSGEAHADSRMWSGALWDLRARLGPELDVAVAAAVRALPDQPSLVQAVEATTEAVRVGLGQAAAEEAAALFAERGLDRCDRLPPLSAPGAADGSIPVSQVGRISPGALQYAVTVPEGAGRITLRLEAEGLAPGSLRLYASIGAPVRYRVHTLSMSSTTVEVDSDAGGTNEVAIEGDALVPGETIYVSPAVLAGRVVPYHLEVLVDRAVTGGEDGGAGDEGGDPPPDPTPTPGPPAEADGDPPAAVGCAGAGGRGGIVGLLLALAVFGRWPVPRREGRAPQPPA